MGFHFRKQKIEIMVSFPIHAHIHHLFITINHTPIEAEDTPEWNKIFKPVQGNDRHQWPQGRQDAYVTLRP